MSTDTDADAETRLKRLSVELDEPIIVGEQVYEDGDIHTLDSPDLLDGPPSEGEAGDVDVDVGVDSALDALGLRDPRGAIRAMYAYLREHEPTQRADFIENVYPDHPAGHESAAAWWSRLGTGTTAPAGTGALCDLPGVRKPTDGQQQWCFDPDAAVREGGEP